MGNIRRWVAVVLTAGVVASSPLGNVITVLAEGETVETVTEGSEGAVAEEQDGQVENSWRYEKGNIIPQVEAYAIADNAWEFDNGSYRDSAGNPIPGAKLKGIDVSEHQKVIDWDRVKADGIDFAILRCGYGSNYSSQDDKYWLRNVSECERLGIPYGVYIYSYAKSVEQAQSEADHVLRLISGHSLSYPVYFDMEDATTIGVGNAMLGQMAKTFCDRITNAGYEVGIYANLNWWSNYLTDPVFHNSAWSKWVAQYNVTCDYNGNYDIWQSTSTAKVDGITGGVDVNFWIDADHPFTDVDYNGWYNDSVTHVYQNGLMTGMNEVTFGPSITTSRAQFVTILHRMEGSPEMPYTAKFPDVASGKFFTNAVMWASENGVVSGYENGYYGAGDEITREQMVTMLYRYANAMGYDVTAGTSLNNRFPDGNSVSAFAISAMQWAVETGIITGNGNGTLAPGNLADRAACATMIMRFTQWTNR